MNLICLELIVQCNFEYCVFKRIHISSFFFLWFLLILLKQYMMHLLLLQLKQGEIKAGKSYIPQGLSPKQYSALRSTERKKKEDNYKRNVAKAGVFEDYTEFYTKRGTDLSQDWAKNKNTLGHRFAKTKFDWSGKSGEANSTTAAVKTAGKKKKFFGKK